MHLNPTLLRKRFHAGLAGLAAAMLIMLTAASAAVGQDTRPQVAELDVDITEGFVEPLPVAVTDFHGDSPEDQRLGSDIAAVISANLERSGFSALRHRLYWHSLLAAPLLLCAMVLIAATFTLRQTRRARKIWLADPRPSRPRDSPPRPVPMQACFRLSKPRSSLFQ